MQVWRTAKVVRTVGALSLVVHLLVVGGNAVGLRGDIVEVVALIGVQGIVVVEVVAVVVLVLIVAVVDVGYVENDVVKAGVQDDIDMVRAAVGYGEVNTIGHDPLFSSLMT